MAVDGQWKIIVDSPMGPQEATATLVTSGIVLSGTAVSGFGGAELEDGRIDGDKATWTITMTVPFPMTLKYEAVFAGDTVSGQVDTGMFGKAPFKGERIG